MPLVNHTRRNAVILVILLFVQLAMMSGEANDVHGSTVLEAWTFRVTSPLVALSKWVGGGVRGVVVGTKNMIGAHRRSAELEGEVHRLREEVYRYREAAQENARLRDLLGMRPDLAPSSIAATVVTANLTDETRLIVLDRGTADGVRVDLPVVAWGGAVGRVVAVYDHHTKVRLITDPNSGVAGVVQRSRAQGMVLGRGTRPLDMLYVQRFSDVLPRDRVVTSGLDGIFPRGFGIGRVIAINDNPAGTRTIQLATEISFSDLEEALILLEPVGGGLLTPREVAEKP